MIGRLSSQYREVLEEVLYRGDTIASRIGLAREMVGFQLTITEPRWCVVDRPGFSRGFMEVEIAQLLGCKYDQEGLAKFASRAAYLIAPETAYGPRIRRQLAGVQHELGEDTTSRRAVLFIARPDDLAAVHDGRAAAARAGEMPCTVSLQFLVRRFGPVDLLHCVATMRSWDLVWGLCYDVPSFVALQMAFAADLGAKLGIISITAGSAHVYERHWNIVPEVRDPGDAGELRVPWIRGNLEATMFEGACRTSGWLESGFASSSSPSISSAKQE